MKKQQQQLIIKAIYQNQKIYMTVIRQKCLHWIVFLAVENPLYLSKKILARQKWCQYPAENSYQFLHDFSPRYWDVGGRTNHLPQVTYWSWLNDVCLSYRFVSIILIILHLFFLFTKVSIIFRTSWVTHVSLWGSISRRIIRY